MKGEIEGRNESRCSISMISLIYTTPIYSIVPKSISLPCLCLNLGLNIDLHSTLVLLIKTSVVIMDIIAHAFIRLILTWKLNFRIIFSGIILI